MNKTLIMGIQIVDREHAAVHVQEILTAHGCIIKTRLGLHETGDGACSSAGLILIEFIMGKQAEVDALDTQLCEIEGVKVRRMEF